MKEYQQRQEAVEKYFKGEKVTDIALFFKKSRKWVHHWIQRFNNKTGDDHWYKDQSKAPKKVNSTLGLETINQIINIRTELMNEKMAQIGAISIQYEC